LVDASVLVARIKDEPGSEAFRDVLSQTPFAVSASTLVEYGAKIFADTRSAERMRSAVRTVEALAAETIAIDEALARLANDALATFGKLAGHPAKLNFGDCLVYAAARGRGLPLLFKGEDFQHTDLVLHEASQDGSGVRLK
jgi:ribonuclease VapC